MSAPLRSAPRESLILGQVRARFEWVATQAEFVSIREDRLAAYAADMRPKPADEIFDLEHHYIGDAEQTAAFVLTLDAINFGSGYKADLVREGWQVAEDSLYFTMAGHLTRRFRSFGPYPAKILAGFSSAECAELLHLPAGLEGQTFARLCAANLAELGSIVLNVYAGSYLALVKSAEGSADAMVEKLAAFRAFGDMPAYKGRPVPVLKRAQSTAADLQDAFLKLGITLFRDIERLTILADNDVPHVLRMDGLLEYNPDLARRIDANLPLESGSPEEVEIRCCAGYIAGRLAALRGWPDITVDRILWHRAAEDGRYKALPPHRTKTIFY